MQLTFIGTRGEIDARKRRHRMHTSLLVSYRSANVMIDCGLDWLGKLKRVSPSAIVLTHAHPDHAEIVTLFPLLTVKIRNAAAAASRCTVRALAPAPRIFISLLSAGRVPLVLSVIVPVTAK
jgi:ribonuclease BN (tRNA processing enzyme)